MRLAALLAGVLAALLFLPVPVALAEDGFSLVVLPDTQVYAWKYPEIFRSQTQWIADHAAAYGIRYVLHVGDVVQHNSAAQWETARQAFATLDGKVPYAIALGNHDLGRYGSTRDRDTLFSVYFPVSGFRGWPTFGGVYDREPKESGNRAHLFSAGQRDWLVLVLEFGPRDDVVRWANGVVSRYPDRSVILLTHAYLDIDGRRYDRRLQGQLHPPSVYPVVRGAGGLNDGEDLWQKLVRRHAYMALVVCGHVGISARLTSRGDAGNLVQQMVVDYQNLERGGQGWLRLLRFSEDSTTVEVQDYSPVLDRWSTDPATHFSLSLSFPTPTAH
jgi:hypothetical protein